MIIDYVKIAVTNLLQRKLRTWLTVIGIVIGIAAIIALVTATQGLSNYVSYQFEKMGTNRILVTPSSFTPPDQWEGITTDDVDVLKKIPGFEHVAPFLFLVQQAEFKRKSETVNILAWPSELAVDIMESYDFKLSSGSMFENDGYHVVIGHLVATDIFDKDVIVNNRLKIKDKNFKVIGIVEEIGNPDDDSQIYMPLETARKLFDKPSEVSFIDMVTKEGVDVNQAAARVQRAIDKERGEDNDLSVQTADQLLEQFSEVLGVINAVLIAVAAISLIVGAIGITNSMYTSVLQRTREIGIMKSIGGTKTDIVTLFLIESALLGFSGGLIGVILGSIAAKIVGVAAASLGYQIFRIELSVSLILFGLIFATVVGMVSGALPAKSAANLKPVDALRK